VTFHVDLLICPKCGGTIHIVSLSFIEEKDIINRILSHRGELEERTHSSPKEEAPSVELTYEPYYDDLPLSEII
jgi:uncharacterized protein YbaR (Trm112 family)